MLRYIAKKSLYQKVPSSAPSQPASTQPRPRQPSCTALTLIYPLGIDDGKLLFFNDQFTTKRTAFVPFHTQAMSYDQLHSNKRRRLLEPTRHGNISTESSWDFDKQSCVFSNRIQDIISSDSPATQVYPEPAASRNEPGRAQRSHNDWRESHCSFKSGSQPIFWRDPNVSLCSPPRPGCRDNLSDALYTRLEDFITANTLTTTTRNNRWPQEISLSHVPPPGTLDGGAPGIPCTHASFDQIPNLNNCNFTWPNYRLRTTHVIPALEVQPPISSTLLGSYTHRNSSDSSSRAQQFFPAAFLDSPLKNLPFQASLSLEGPVEPSQLSSEMSDVGVEDEVEETGLYGAEEEPRDLESEVICFGMVSPLIQHACSGYKALLNPLSLWALRQHVGRIF